MKPPGPLRNLLLVLDPVTASDELDAPPSLGSGDERCIYFAPRGTSLPLSQTVLISARQVSEPST